MIIYKKSAMTFLIFTALVLAPGFLSATVLNVSCSVDGSSPCPSGSGSINSQTVTFFSDIQIPAGACPGTIIDVNVSIDIQHSELSDLTIRILHGTTAVILWQNQCSGSSDLNVLFDDDANGVPVVCNSPSTGTIIPVEGLFSLDELEAEGLWQLVVQDFIPGNSGEILDWGLQIECEDPQDISIENGFIKLDTTNGEAPRNVYCSLPDHWGRMSYDRVSDRLYICSDTGWKIH